MQLRWALLFILSLLICQAISTGVVHGQSIVHGSVIDASTLEPMIGARVSVRNDSIEAFTNVDGRFVFEADLSEALSMEITAKGFQRRTITIYDTVRVSIELERIFSQGYRHLESDGLNESDILNSDRAVDRIQGSELHQIPNGQLSYGINNYPGVQSFASGLNNSSFGIRGFTSTSHDKLLTLVDGTDARLPGFGSSLGGFSLPAEIDIAAIEIIQGPSTARFGAGAYQGLLSVITKDPWNDQGIEARLYGGSGSSFDGQLRFAQAFGKGRKWAFSFSGQFQRMDDRAGVSRNINYYGRHQSFTNLDSLLNSTEDFSAEERAKLAQLSNWISTTQPNAAPGNLFPSHPGFEESEVFEPEARKLKLGGSLHFKPSKQVELEYAFRISNGSMVHTQEQRLALHNMLWHQHELKASGKNWKVNLSTGFETLGNSYSISRNAELINAAGAESYSRQVLTNYADSLSLWSNGFTQQVTDSLISAAKDSALRTARSSWYAPGTNAFDSIAEIGQNFSEMGGAAIVSTSNNQLLSGQYHFDFEWMETDLGVRFKRNAPSSGGQLFSDTTNLMLMEYGGWANFNFHLLRGRLFISSTIRVDKSDLFSLQVQPRVGIRYNWKQHSLRASFNSGYRNPTFWELYRSNATGYGGVTGNPSGFEALITQENSSSINQVYEAAVTNGIWPTGCPEGDLECLIGRLSESIQVIDLKQLQPERVNSIEAGYRSVIFKNFYLDIGVSYNLHHNLIAYRNYTKIPGSENHSSEQLVEVVVSDSIAKSELLVPSNSEITLQTIVGTINTTYHFSDKVWANLNYTYSYFLNSNDGIPTLGFNVPTSRLNVGFRVKDLWDHLGFSFNYQWAENHTWSGPIGSLDIPSYSLIDAQISYRIPVMYSTFRIGGSNIINTPIEQIAGGPALGATLYAAIQFDLGVR